jgi:xylulose-5-phosphate/fructose-6-phosphate phosphoketolase
MFNQHAEWLKVCNHIPWRRPIASLNHLLSSPPDANCLLSVTDHCLRSRNYVNVVVAGKQPAQRRGPHDAAIRERAPAGRNRPSRYSRCIAP